MQFWVLTILRLSNKLQFFSEKIDKLAMDTALVINSDTLKTYDKILRLNEKKVLVVNLEVMLKKMLASLKNEDRLLIENYAFGMSLEMISKILGVNKSTVSRRINKIVKRCGSTLVSLGYSRQRFEREYKDYAPVYSMFAKIRRDYFARQHLSTKHSEEKNVTIPYNFLGSEEQALAFETAKS